MLSFSLIIPTINRKKELENLLESIKNIQYNELEEIIVIDQNENNLIDDVVEKYKKILPIQHYKVNFKGTSKAKNYGAKMAKGDIINFPDDDSQILPQTLSTVNEMFKEKKEYSVICGKIEDKEEKQNILNFKNKNVKVNFSNLYQTTIECNMFFKRKEFLKVGMFDPNLGIGKYYGAEEGADLVCRMLYKKIKIYYINETFFYHPNKKREEDIEKYYRYGLGTGGFARKHLKEYKCIIPFIYLTLKNVKSFFLIFISFIKRDKYMINKQIHSIKGRMKGLLGSENSEGSNNT